MKKIDTVILFVVHEMRRCIRWEKSSRGEDINSSLVLHPNVHSSEEILQMKASSQIFQIQESSQISSNLIKYN